MAKLQEMGEFVRSASSTIEAPVVRRLKEAFADQAAAVRAAAGSASAGGKRAANGHAAGPAVAEAAAPPVAPLAAEPADSHPAAAAPAGPGGFVESPQAGDGAVGAGPTTSGVPQVPFSQPEPGSGAGQVRPGSGARIRQAGRAGWWWPGRSAAGSAPPRAAPRQQPVQLTGHRHGIGTAGPPRSARHHRTGGTGRIGRDHRARPGGRSAGCARHARRSEATGPAPGRTAGTRRPR